MSEPDQMGDARSGRGGGYRWELKDSIIAVLVVLLLVVGANAWLGRQGAGQAAAAAAGDGDPVTVFDLVLDRENRAYLDVFFDRSVGHGMAGQVLAQPPAVFFPALSGVWKWRDTNTLRFEPSGGFPMAREYRLTLLPERVLGEGQVLAGEREFTVRTDQFLVETVEVFEEPAAGGEGRVTLRGSIGFNYEVEPGALAPRIRLEDPEAGTVEVLLETSWPDRVISFHSGEVVKSPKARGLKLVIAGDLTPADGDVALGQDFTREIFLGSRDELTVRSVASEPGLERSTIKIVFSSPMDAAAAKKYISLDGVESFAVTADRNILLLSGAFSPGNQYALSIDGGLPARDGAILLEPYSTAVLLNDLEPTATFQEQGMFLPAGGPGNVALETVNVERLELTVDRIYRNNLFFFFQREGRGYFRGYNNYVDDVWRAAGDRIVETSIPVRRQRNAKVVTLLPVEDLVAGDQPGLYRVFVGQPDNWQAEHRWLLVTGIGAVAKQGRDEFLVWAVNNRTLRPVSGARVTLLSDQNQTIGSGRTDSAGFWRLGNNASFEEHRPYLVTIENGDDFTFLLLDQMQVDTAGLEVNGSAGVGDGYSSFIYGERDIYRPGETLRGAALVRDRRLAPAPPMPVLLRHIDPEGRELETRRLTLDDSGAAEIAIELPLHARTGHHSLELKAGEQVIGSYPFQVEEFVPDRIKVAIRVEAAAAGGAPLRGEVASSYLFGPPAEDLVVETRVRLADASFSAPGYEGFSFRNDDRKFDDREVFFEEARLDGEGRRAFSAALPPELEAPSSLEALVTARVMEAGGRGVSALQRVALHPYPYYVGLRRQAEGYARPGEETVLEYAAVKPDGSAAVAGPLRLELFRDRWHTVLRRTPAGTYSYQSTRESELLEQRQVDGAAAGTAVFTPAEYGNHRVVITDERTGASASISFSASGWGYAPWAMEHPGRVELELDREEYRSGQAAAVEIRAPFPGKLLLTVEGDRVLETVVRELEGNTATIELPVRETWRPNVYLTATLVRRAADLEPGGAGRAFGAVPLYVDRSTNRLAMKLTAAETVRSSSRLEVALETEPGATVTIAAVDEGILQLIAQQTADPFAFFYRKLALGVVSFDSFSLLLPDLAAAVSETGGGAAGGLAQHVRTAGIQRIKPVTYWSGLLRADRNGRARAEIEIPQFQGGLRLMAVAAEGRRFGSAEQMVRVRDPLVLTPTLPRALSFGERLKLPVTLRNDTGSDGEFVLRLAVEGQAAAGAESEVRLPVPDGRERIAWFTATSGTLTGDARFVITAQGNGERARAEIGVPVRPDLPPLSRETAGPVEQAEVEIPLGDDGGLRPETVQRTLRVGSLPLVQFSGKLSALLRYPYGCMEQVVSTAFPLIYLGDLARELDPELLDPAKGQGDPALMVQTAVRRAMQNQVPGGGFALWSSGQTFHPWVSVYTTHFLVEASLAGHPVDQGLLRRALDHLQNAVKSKGGKAYGTEELQRTAYALYVLARAGEPDLGSMDYLRERQAGKLTAESRGLLAAAYASTGSFEAAQELETRIGEIDRTDRQTGKNFDSAVRNRAMLLLALLDIDPQNHRIPQLADRLARDARTDSWWTTQETGFALLALGRLYRLQSEHPPWSGTVTMAGEALGRVTSEEPARFDLPAAGGPLRVVMDAGFEPGAAFFSLVTRGVPEDDAFRPAAEGLEIERTFHDRAGAGLDPARLVQGDLVVIKTRVRSVSGAVENVVLVNLLPSCLEVENPRLESTESLPWVTDVGRPPDHLDLRDDRILIFTDLPANTWQTYYTLARAVSPGTFRLPPVHAEAMYNPALRATGPRGVMETARRGQAAVAAE
jgi:uncharacterized protein YfaS (alpha-2-macroglobulin family)